MADDLRAKIAEMFACRCDPAWTERQLHAPDCVEELGDEVLEAVAEWLRAEAMELRRIADRVTLRGTLSTAVATATPHSLLMIANGLEDRARSLTQPSTEESHE